MVSQLDINLEINFLLQGGGFYFQNFDLKDFYSIIASEFGDLWLGFKDCLDLRLPRKKK